MNEEKIACYCRVSTKKEEQRLSLENQKRFFEEFTQRAGIEDYQLYVDEGISAKSMKKRDNFLRMVSDAKKGLINRILVKDISRFARNTYDFLGVIRELKSINVRVEFVTYAMTTEDSEFTLTILAAVAQEESANLSKRVKFGKEEGAKNGRVPCMVYGYRKDPKDKYTLNIIPAEAAVVKRIYELYANHQMSTYQIANLLNQEGIPTRRGGNYKWSQTVISGILRNRLYKGEVCNGKSTTKNFITGERNKIAESEWLVVKRPEFQLIDNETWEKANAIRNSRSNTFHQFEDDGKIKKKRPSIKYPLSNLLVCANDNYAYRRRHREYPSGLAYTYWTCSKRDLGAASCDNAGKIDEGQMQQAIIRFLKALFDNQDSIRKEFRAKMGKELYRKYEKQIDHRGLKKERHALFLDREKLMDLFMHSNIDKNYLEQAMKPIERRLAELEKTLSIFENQDKVSRDIEKCLAKMIERLDHNEDWLDNAFLKTIFEKFLIHADGTIEAIIKVDADSGSSLTIPFGEIADGSKLGVPKHTDGIQYADGLKPTYGQLAGENRGAGSGHV